jgi:hypothetical protein
MMMTGQIVRRAMSRLWPIACVTILACASQEESNKELPPMPLPPWNVRDVGGIERVARPLTGATWQLMEPMGGNGGGVSPGSPFFVNNAVIYAFQGRTGQVVDQITFAFYVPTNSNNLFTPGDPLGTYGPIGGSGGGPNPPGGGWIQCPGGKAALGFAGMFTSVVTRFGLVCGSPQPGVDDCSSGGAGCTETTQIGPGGGMTYQNRLCSDVPGVDPNGNPEVVIGVVGGLTARNGSFVDQLWGTCNESWRFPI